MDYKRHVAYSLISRFYGKRTAKRSGVPLINHIDEGVEILFKLFGDTQEVRVAVLAYCIHPLVQSDEDLKKNYRYTKRYINANVLAHAMEYRNIANQYLLKKYKGFDDEINLSPLMIVNMMLVADKVQNFKDFLIHHYCKHEKSPELFNYFNNWIRRLNKEFKFTNQQKEIIEQTINRRFVW